MRRTGKLYTLTLVSCAMAILASVLASLWNEHTSAFHLWVDLIPQGFGMASFITSTLIVGIFFFRAFYSAVLNLGLSCVCRRR